MFFPTKYCFSRWENCVSAKLLKFEAWNCPEIGSKKYIVNWFYSIFFKSNSGWNALDTQYYCIWLVVRRKSNRKGGNLIFDAKIVVVKGFLFLSVSDGKAITTTLDFGKRSRDSEKKSHYILLQSLLCDEACRCSLNDPNPDPYCYKKLSYGELKYFEGRVLLKVFIT